MTSSSHAGMGPRRTGRVPCLGLATKTWVVTPAHTVQYGQQDQSSPWEGLVFHSKSKKEQLQDRSVSLADTAATVADQLRERVAPAIGQAAGSAKEWGQPRVEAARLWACLLY